MYKDKWINKQQHEDYTGWLHGWTDRQQKEQEILDALLEAGIKKEELDSVFEIGCGACTNLLMLDDGNNLLMGNDLSKEASLRHVQEKNRPRIQFIEQDTLTLFSGPPIHVDLFMSIDHCMHLHKDSVAKVMEGLDTSWKPKHILIREAASTSSNRNEHSELPRLGHTYDLPNYELIVDRTSALRPSRSYDNHVSYFIRVYRRKGI